MLEFSHAVHCIVALISEFTIVSILSQVRVSKEQDHILISPRGLSFAEVTAANLVRTMAAWAFIFPLGIKQCTVVAFDCMCH